MGGKDASHLAKISMRKGKTVAVKLHRMMPVVATRMDHIPNLPCAAGSVAIDYAYVGKSGACAAVCRTM
eukprot:3918378-Ditylum_brightwellii.AAC.1